LALPHIVLPSPACIGAVNASDRPGVALSHGRYQRLGIRGNGVGQHHPSGGCIAEKPPICALMELALLATGGHGRGNPHNSSATERLLLFTTAIGANQPGDGLSRTCRPATETGYLGRAISPSD
jgi:hypothetical protein